MTKALVRVSEQVEAHLIRSLKILIHKKQTAASHQNLNATEVL